MAISDYIGNRDYDFGTKRLKNIGGDLGGAIKGFKKSMADDEPTKELDEQSDTTADKKDQ